MPSSALRDAARRNHRRRHGAWTGRHRQVHAVPRAGHGGRHRRLGVPSPWPLTPGGAAYAPLIEAVEAVVAQDRSVLERLTDQVRSTLAALTPLAAPAPPLMTGLSRHMIFGAIHRLLMHHPDVTGVLLVVDDVHLADDGTAEACVQLARARPAAATVVASYRCDAARQSLTGGLAGLQRAGRARSST